MNEFYKRRKPFKSISRALCIMLAFAALSVGVAEASRTRSAEKNQAEQQKKISIKGRVFDPSGAPIVGANIVIKGTTIGTPTNIEGQFNLMVTPGSILEVSFLGFKKQEIKVGDKTTFNIKLVEDSEEMDQVVVIGYQSVTKKNVHGAISSINLKDVQGVTAPSVDAMLQGMIPGLSIQTMTGEPGGRNTFNIRGNNSVLDKNAISEPLFVLDGVPVDASVVGYSATSTNFLTNINPSDIESIDVLKDAASASIYGSRAANGVVLIKTKRGKAGASKVTFSGRYGMAFKPELPTVYTGVAERRKRLEMFAANSTYLSQSELPLILTDSLNPAFNNNTDWYDLFYRQATTQDYNISLSGGNETMSYRMGGGYFNQEGTMNGTGFSRFSFTSNIINKIGDRLTFNTNAAYTLGSRQALPGNSVTDAVNLGIGDMPSSLLYLSDLDKMRYTGTYNSVRNDNSDESIRLSEFINFKITDWLVFNSMSAYDSYNSRLDKFSPSAISNISRSEASADASKAVSLNFENYLNIDKKFNDHHITGVLGITANRTKNYFSRAAGSYIPSDLIQTVSGVPQQYKEAYSDFFESGMVGMFARSQYYYKDKYSVFASVRRDGSSKLAQENRWGTFPSFGAFWTISEEPFMGNFKKTLSFLKFRTSYGRSGNQPSGSPYGYLSRYSVAGTYDGATGITPNFYDGVAQRDLTWESTEEVNIGLDAEFLGGRFFFSADFYNKDIDGLFYTLDMPNTSGYDKYNTNSVGVRNRGVEFMLRTNMLPSSMKDWNWSITTTASYNKNLISALPFNNRTIVEDSRYLTVGRPINQFNLAIYDGVFSTDEDVPINPYTGDKYLSEMGAPYRAGDAFLRDIDGNYKWVSYQDKSPVGNPNPKWTGGIYSSTTWKNLTLDIHCSFTAGRDVLNQSLSRTLSSMNTTSGANEEGMPFSNTGYMTTWSGGQDYVARRMLTYIDDLSFWTKPGDVAQYPNLSMYRNLANFSPNTSQFLEDGSYFKMNSIMLSYRIPAASKYNIGNLRLSLTAENIFVLTSKNCHIPDPQNVTSDGYYSGNGYGLPRMITFGVQLDL